MKTKAHISGILFALMFGFSFMFSKTALESNYVTPIGLIAYRFLLAFIIYEVFRLLKIIRINFSKKKLLSVFFVAIFQPILYFIFEVYGLNLTTSSEAGMMIALIPIFVVILSTIFLNEKPTKLQLLFIFLSISGIFVIQIFKPNQEDSNSSILGLIILLGAVLSAASFNIASRKTSKTIKPLELTYFMMLFGAIAFNGLYIVQLLTNHTLNNYFDSLTHMEIIFPIIYLGVVSSTIAFLLVNYTLSKLPAHVSSIYANLSTVVAVITGHFVLHEELGVFGVIGGVMIITGVYGVARINSIKA